MGSTLTVDNIVGATTAANVKLPAGSILQTQTYTKNVGAHFQTTSTSYVTNSDMPNVVITPKFQNSKFFIQAMIGMQHDTSSGQVENTIFRTVGGVDAELSNGNTYGLSFTGVAGATGVTCWEHVAITWVDVPNTTNAITYKWYSRSESGANIYPLHGGCSVSMVVQEISV